jgi:hypothetical protein
MINFDITRFIQEAPAQSIPLYRVAAALAACNNGRRRRLPAVLHMINAHRVCPRSVAMPRTVTYDGYGRIYH